MWAKLSSSGPIAGILKSLIISPLRYMKNTVFLEIYKEVRYWRPKANAKFKFYLFRERFFTTNPSY